MTRVLIITLTFIFLNSLAFAADLASRVEVKLSVSTDHLSQSMKSLQYNSGKAEIRKIYFIDAPGLPLYRQNLLLRVRLGSKKNTDFTLKQRPADENFDWSNYQDQSDFKCELDMNAVTQVTACSLKQDLSPQDIQMVLDQKKNPKSLVSDEQKNLIAGLGTTTDWKKMTLLGPVLSTAWTLKYDGMDVDVELWQLDKDNFLEISSRSKILDQGVPIRQRLSKLLTDLGLVLDSAQMSKTDFVLKKLNSASRRGETK